MLSASGRVFERQVKVCEGIPSCLHTHVPCKPCKQALCVLGDMSTMPGTIEEALASLTMPDGEALDIEFGAIHAM